MLREGSDMAAGGTLDECDFVSLSAILAPRDDESLGGARYRHPVSRLQQTCPGAV